MRIAFISDLHAITTCLHAVLDELDREGIDRIICLGDIVDIGPTPCAVVDLLQERNIPCVRGNHDRLEEHPSFPFLRDLEHWTREDLGEERLSWLMNLPTHLDLELGPFKLLAVHGTPQSDDVNLAPTPTAALNTEALDGVTADLVLCGHTHVQADVTHNGVRVVNAGSLGMPYRTVFNGAPPAVLPWSDYAVVEATDEGLKVDLRRRPINLDAIKAEALGSKMPHQQLWIGQWYR